jgi:hypothetical protein
MTDVWLRKPAAPLLALGREIGIPETRWSQREELELLSYADLAMDRDQVVCLSMSTVGLLVGTYGDAFTCRFKLGSLTVLSISRDTDEQALASFRTELRDSPSVNMELRIDKGHLIENWLGVEPLCQRFLYLFPDAFSRLLHSSLTRLEGLLWKTNAAAKVVILVPELEVWLSGDYFAVLGGGRIGDWRDVLPRVPPEISTSQRMYSACRDNLKWQEAHVRQITPLHLRLRGQSLPQDPVANALIIHEANLIALFTADRSSCDSNGKLIAIYEGAGQTVPVPLYDPTVALSEDVARGIEDLFQMVEWIYEPRWVSDRLALAQVSIAQVLGAEKELDREKRLLQSAGNLHGNLRWHWKAFIEGKISAYDVELRKLEDYVSDTVKAFSDQINEMIKSLSDTMLAAIAAVLGSFVAALFKDKFNATVFTIGMACYALYVCAFPLAYNMLNQLGRYRSLTKRFASRQARIATILLAEKVTEISTPQIKDSRNRFWRWFAATALAYVVVIGLALAAIQIAPPLFQSTQAASTTLPSLVAPAPTPGPTAHP